MKDTVPLDPINEYLAAIYGEPAGERIATRLQALIEKYRSLGRTSGPVSLSERDAILITYGDQVKREAERPLQTLAQFSRRWLAGIVPGIHLLPFYPYSSDDGFSVIDYRAVDPALGNWEDVALIGRSFRLMFDAVINHISVKSAWFKGFLKDDPHYRQYFIVVDGDPDLSQVVRPRALPLLTPFQTASGEKRVWTTFSDDQVDLNYHNPEVLLDIFDTLLFYIQQGAELIRLDAIAYLWKEIGTTCIHLPQTHRIIQLLRAMLDQVAPHVMLITETNVPHEENISYFGNGSDEAQLVYNFALPPLVLYTLHSADASILSSWARGLKLPTRQVTFFNFLASHDGIGINPARGILPQEGIELLLQKTQDHGGVISYKNNPDGTQSPYELNINYFDALCDPKSSAPVQAQVDRFMAAQAIMLALIGVPGIYFHSLFGSRGWHEGVRLTGRNRTINRQKLGVEELERQLTDPASRRSLVYAQFERLLNARAASPAFHPTGDQRVLECGESIFAIERSSIDHQRHVLCLQNVSDQACGASIDPADLARIIDAEGRSRDLISGRILTMSAQDAILLKPYETLWLESALAG